MVVERWAQTHHPRYEVSDKGRVRSQGKVLALQTNGRGYLQVLFWTDCKPEKVYVHRLVASAFMGPIPPGLLVLHKDDNPGNAALTNLTFGTPLDNVRDMHTKGRARKARGSNSGKAVLHESDIPRIRKWLTRGHTRKAIASHYGVSVGCIRRIAEGTTWQHVP